ncbi:hypothetical protein DFH27DRAFT_536114 [Peziza echinospora]|nr:hypothetical protein DFH27DRAFT_536114 [Peziza echinospora]
MYGFFFDSLSVSSFSFFFFSFLSSLSRIFCPLPIPPPFPLFSTFYIYGITGGFGYRRLGLRFYAFGFS